MTMQIQTYTKSCNIGQFEKQIIFDLGDFEIIKMATKRLKNGRNLFSIQAVQQQIG